MITREKKGEIDMTAPKKTEASAAKASETVKAETVMPKATVKKPVAAAPKAEEKKEAAKAVAEKKDAAPKAAEKKAAEKKTAAPKAEKPAKKAAAKKAEQKSEIHVQFSGKSYSQDELVKIAKDVWKYDLKQKARDLTSIELYVKPEENKVYYVMNKEYTGDFNI